MKSDSAAASLPKRLARTVSIVVQLQCLFQAGDPRGHGHDIVDDDSMGVGVIVPAPVLHDRRDEPQVRRFSSRAHQGAARDEAAHDNALNLVLVAKQREDILGLHCRNTTGPLCDSVFVVCRRGWRCKRRPLLALLGTAGEHRLQGGLPPISDLAGRNGLRREVDVAVENGCRGLAGGLEQGAGCLDDLGLDSGRVIMLTM